MADYNSAVKPAVRAASAPAAAAGPRRTDPIQPSTVDAGGKGINSAFGNIDWSSRANAMTKPRSADNAAAQAPAAQQPIPNGYMGIRSTMGDRGAEWQLGWNDKTGHVTIGGIDAYKPDVNINGTTYADEKAINDLTNKAYERAGDPLMAARAYMNSIGLPGSVNWDGTSGTMSVGGINIKPTYVSDGIAYVPQSQLEAAAEAYRKQTGIRTPQSLVYDYESKYGNRIDAALRQLESMGGYSSDPSKNPIYQQYAKEKQKQAEAAYRQVLNANDASAYGASGAVLAEALAAKRNYLDSLAADWERLDNTAYSRYRDDIDRQRNNLNDLMTVGNDRYNKSYQAAADAYNRTFAGAQYTDDRYDTEWAHRQQEWQNAQTAEQNRLINEQQDINNQIARYNLDTYPEERHLQLEGMGIENDYNRARADAAALENEQSMSYAGGGVVTDTQPTIAKALRSFGWVPREDGVYIWPETGEVFNWINSERYYTGLQLLDKQNAALAQFYLTPPSAARG